MAATSRVGVLLVLAACGGGERGAKTDATGMAGTPAATDTASDEPKPFKLGDLIEPFTPPKLDELEKTVEWVDMPVLDSMEIDAGG